MAPFLEGEHLLLLWLRLSWRSKAFDTRPAALYVEIADPAVFSCLFVRLFIEGRISFTLRVGKGCSP